MNAFWVTFCFWFFGIIFGVLSIWFSVWMFLMTYRMCRDIHKISIGDIRQETRTDKYGDEDSVWLDKIFTWDFYRKKLVYIYVFLGVVFVWSLCAGGAAYSNHQKVLAAEKEYQEWCQQHQINYN